MTIVARHTESEILSIFMSENAFGLRSFHPILLNRPGTEYARMWIR
jgi:hypothetical protein